MNNAHPIRTTGAELDAMLARAREFETLDLRATKAEYNKKDDLITLHFADGIRVSIPRKKLQGLQDAKPSELAKIELLGRGTGLHWPELDVDHYVPGLLNHVFGTARWMAEIGRKGGSAKSRAKTRAARVNGKRGGRPKSVGQSHLPHHTMAGD
jgi:Protein of unknown function (DUF2442)